MISFEFDPFVSDLPACEGYPTMAYYYYVNGKPPTPEMTFINGPEHTMSRTITIYTEDHKKVGKYIITVFAIIYDVSDDLI